MNGQVEGSLTSNFKVSTSILPSDLEIQGHVRIKFSKMNFHISVRICAIEEILVSIFTY